MKGLYGCFLFLVPIMLPGTPGAATPEGARPAAVKKAPKGIPAGAERIDASTYRFKDQDGKVWIFRRTPFGFSRHAQEPKPAAAQTRAAKAKAVKVVDEGDQLRFERSSPFGKFSWVRKKSELTPEEKKIWDDARHTPTRSPARTSPKTGQTAREQE